MTLKADTFFLNFNIFVDYLLTYKKEITLTIYDGGGHRPCKSRHLQRYCHLLNIYSYTIMARYNIIHLIWITISNSFWQALEMTLKELSLKRENASRWRYATCGQTINLYNDLVQYLAAWALCCHSRILYTKWHFNHTAFRFLWTVNIWREEGAAILVNLSDLHGRRIQQPRIITIFSQFV